MHDKVRLSGYGEGVTGVSTHAHVGMLSHLRGSIPLLVLGEGRASQRLAMATVLKTVECSDTPCGFDPHFFRQTSKVISYEVR